MYSLVAASDVLGEKTHSDDLPHVTAPMSRQGDDRRAGLERRDLIVSTYVVYLEVSISTITKEGGRREREEREEKKGPAHSQVNGLDDAHGESRTSRAHMANPTPSEAVPRGGPWAMMSQGIRVRFASLWQYLFRSGGSSLVAERSRLTRFPPRW